METNCQYIPYQNTGFFLKTVIDYLNQSQELQAFYNYPVSLQGIQQSINARQNFTTNRQLLVDVLKEQHKGLSLSPSQQKNIELLLSNDTFTVTTAHQPNIFTGPLYFIYKILHAAKLADELKQQLPQYNFVPVYYMGSEDADLDELGFINLNGEKLVWQTKQTGAVGRMKVDKAFIKLIDVIHGQIGVEKYGDVLTDLFKQCYTEGKTIQQATLELVNYLFADFGVLIVVPDNKILKQSFESVIQKELTEQFSHKAVEATIAELSKHYKVQAGGRDLNLFYLIDDKRERIEIRNSKFEIRNLNLEWSHEEILDELQNHPERFSTNVILRGVFQETILPNIAFIGGGGELAYWLELKKVFEAVHVPYPMLILRNSFLILSKNQKEKIAKLGFTVEGFFKNENDLLNALVKKESSNQLCLDKEINQAKDFYHYLKNIAGAVDVTLQQHTEALQAKALKQLTNLEKKMLRAEKRKFDTQQQQLHQLKQSLFPNNSLQERTDNFSLFYAKNGNDLLHAIYQASKGLQQEFGVVEI
ncbi:MAG: bacillithiol biosynthesis cysteine-adding enzyme BshC [Chitinophaga sp.]|jgi:bacillithiol biosynthesis cysteine-adding enzyme BshC|nr:bacillithiol biosynthesis cysteine-adding enzyme BshC [Chitinophaga sp.]